MIAPFANFYGKIWVGFCLNTGKHFAISEPWERVWILLKKILGVFKIAFGFRNWHVFMWQPLEIFNIFTTLCVKLIFWKTKTLFKKLEYRFLVQITKIECAIFPHKTALPKANAQTNKMRSTKWTYYKEEVLLVTTLFFLKFLF